MLFSSIPFLYYFLPCVLILYMIVPKNFKNGALLLASLVFYAWGEPVFVVLMMLSIVLGYIFGLLIEKYRGTKACKPLMIVSVAISLGFLGYFKYADFFLENVNMLLGVEIPLLRIALPIGISFYTFQLLSYTVDVCRGEVSAQKNLINLAAYITMFPQLIAGPIVRYIDVEKQLRERTHSYEKILSGIERFMVGLGKKILISNALGELCEIFRASDDKSVVFFWVYAISYTLQIYFDFSGYSDMAIGLGKFFGFDFLENFNYPYISKSITEFWRRWHMSLGSWFRDYVYIPLGGNRVSKGRWYFNIFVVWALTGMWHGAEWNFIIWGLYFAVLLVLEKQLLLKRLEKAKIWNHIYVMLLIIISFVIFNAKDMAEAFEYIGGMFGFGKVPLLSTETIYYLRSYVVLLAAAIIGSTPYVKNAVLKLLTQGMGRKLLPIVRPIWLAVIFVVCTAYLIDSSFNPFLYFRF